MNFLKMGSRLMRVFTIVLASLLLFGSHAWAGPYAPRAGQPGSTAIANTSPTMVEWANGFQDLIRGPLNIADPGAGLASYGAGGDALGYADGISANVVSLGDGGRITLSFAQPITNGLDFDFAVFENGFGFSSTLDYLELAFVEVSSNGADFVRFPTVSLTPTATQVGSFGALDPTNLDNLAGSFRGGFGTPFDLGQLRGVSALLDVDRVEQVRILDVVGTIDPLFATFDTQNHIVNDPWPTAFGSGGFDLDAVAVLHQTPEPGSCVLGLLAAVFGWATFRRWTRRSRGV